ncbi:cellulose-binding protein, partial [Streptomyces sp. PGLac3x]
HLPTVADMRAPLTGAGVAAAGAPAAEDDSASRGVPAQQSR